MEAKPSENSVEGNKAGESEESSSNEEPVTGAAPVHSEQTVPPTLDPIGANFSRGADTEQTGVHEQERNQDLTPEPRDPNSGRMTFLTAIIAVATVINIGVFWYESEDSSKKIETLSNKAGEIVGTMNTALSNN